MPTTRTCFVILLVRQDDGYIEWGAVTNCRPDASYEDGDVVFFVVVVYLWISLAIWSLILRLQT
jgi:hypothetical protein